MLDIKVGSVWYRTDNVGMNIVIDAKDKKKMLRLRAIECSTRGNVPLSARYEDMAIDGADIKLIYQV